MIFDTGVFERRGFSSLSEKFFAIFVGLIIVSSIAMTLDIGLWFLIKIHGLNATDIIIFGVVIPGIALCVTVLSSNLLTKIIGYIVTSQSSSVVILLISHYYYPNLFLKILIGTMGVLGVVTISTMINLNFVKKRRYIVVSVIIYSIFLPFFGITTQTRGVNGYFEWLGILVLSFYCLYHWNRAMKIQRNPNNIIDVALSLYLNILNLIVAPFVHLKKKLTS